MNNSETYAAEITRRFELAEYFAIKMLYDNVAPHDTINFRANAILYVLNPKNNYHNEQFVKDRELELETKYFDETGRLRD